MRRAMLFTVGTGSTIENAIAFSTFSFNPDAVYLLCTTGEDGSIGKLDAIHAAMAERGLQRELVREPVFLVRDMGDFERTYEDCRRALMAIRDEGFGLGDITVDYTSGNKVMSVSLVIAAINLDIGRYVYIDGTQRGGPGMRVVDTTEQARATAAGRVRAEPDLRLAISLFNACQWDAAVAVADEALRKCAAGPTCEQATALRELARAYSHWDQFEHDEARKILMSMDARQAEAIGVDIGRHKQFLYLFDEKVAKQRERQDREVRERVAEALAQTANEDEALEVPPQLASGTVELLWARLADLLNNAERRLAQSLNDDAIQRAYRATELLAQIPFAEFDPPIDAAGPIPVERFPEEVQAKWACRADAKGQLRLGLTDLYALLLDLGHPLGEWFADDAQQPLQWALTARNQTILAHGFTTARTEDVRTILDSVGPKAAALNKRVAQWREYARFQRADLSPTAATAPKEL